MEIGNRLKIAREEEKKSMQEVADIIGVSKNQIYIWEKEKQEMGITKLKALCLLYNVSADWILGLSNKKSRG